MSRGHPDFSSNSPTKLGARLSDMAELAVRLGSFNTYDRLGLTRFQTDFSEGLDQWVTGGGGGNIILSTENALFGQNSAAFVDTSGGTVEQWMSRTLAPIRNTKIGFEATFMFSNLSGSIEFEYLARNGSSDNNWAWTVSYNANRITLGNSLSQGELVSGADWRYEVVDMWHTMKVVFNTETLKYTRFRINDDSFDPSLLAGAASGAGSTDFGRIKVTFSGGGANSPQVFLDNLILTVDEP